MAFNQTNHLKEMQLRELIKKIPPEDFDGHTDFGTLTPVQRLEWLSQTAMFLWQIRAANRKQGKQK